MDPTENSGNSIPVIVQIDAPSSDSSALTQIALEPAVAIAIDPVCHMIVPQAGAADEITYRGTTYFFCNSNCVLKFSRDPLKYIPADVLNGEDNSKHKTFSDYDDLDGEEATLEDLAGEAESSSAVASDDAAAEENSGDGTPSLSKQAASAAPPKDDAEIKPIFVTIGSAVEGPALVCQTEMMEGAAQNQKDEKELLVQYSCPMHADVLTEKPGPCPLCGMALDPLDPTAAPEDDSELIDMEHRLKWALPFTVATVIGNLPE